MRSIKLLAVVGVLLILSGLTIALVSAQDNGSSLPSTLSGIVVGRKGPLAGALVQVQATPNTAKTDENGAFTLRGLGGAQPVVITAWSAGYYIAAMTLDPSAPDWDASSPLTITLRSLPVADNNEYDWFSEEGVEGSAACGLCHREYEEWTKDAHSQAAVNPRFISMYTGTDVNGQVGQEVKWELGVALPPDPDLPYYGPGFLRDYPSRAGSCAACHTPMASKIKNEQNCAWSGCHTSFTIERSNGFIDPHVLPLALKGDALEGISCEFCHKIGDVYVDSETKLPKPDMPGILSVRLYRPKTEEDQVFFGPLMDVARPDSYLPLQSESRFCASCHYGVLGGVVGNGTVTGGILVYNSYGEWLESPYSDPAAGVTCQGCHMPVSDRDTFVLAERGGLTRDYVDLHNHTMPGVSDINLLQNSVTMNTRVQRDGNALEVEVSITNDKTGHHIPTDSPIRSMILVVQAFDAAGEPLELSAGPVNPAYSGDLGGLPGKTFAKVLRDEWTGETPTGAIWRPIALAEDTRIAALATDTTAYTFNAPEGETVTVDVRLVFRRAFYDLMKQKGWNDPDILMEYEYLQIPAD